MMIIFDEYSAHLLNDLEGAQRKSDFASSEEVEDGKYDSKTFEQAKITEGRELDTLNLSDINHDDF
jgi:hypothetical protein